MKTLKKIEEIINQVRVNNSFFDGISISTNMDSKDITLSYSMGFKIIELNMTPFEIIEDSYEYGNEIFKESEFMHLGEKAEVFSNKGSKVKEVLSVEDVCEKALKLYSKHRIESIKNTFKKHYEDSGNIKSANNNFVQCLTDHFNNLTVEKEGRTISTKHNDQIINMYIDDSTSVVSNNNEKYTIDINDPFEALEHLFNEVSNHHIEESLNKPKVLVKEKNKKNKKLKLH